MKILTRLINFIMSRVNKFQEGHGHIIEYCDIPPKKKRKSKRIRRNKNKLKK